MVNKRNPSNRYRSRYYGPSLHSPEHDAAFKSLARWRQDHSDIIDNDWWMSLFDDLDIEGEDVIINVADHLAELLIIEK